MGAIDEPVNGTIEEPAKGMNVIYANSEEKFLKAVRLYPDTNGVLCLDEDATKKISKAGLINLFEKGEILIEEEEVDGKFAPVTMEIAEDKAMVVAMFGYTITTDDGTEFVLDPLVFYSDTESEK